MCRKILLTLFFLNLCMFAEKYTVQEREQLYELNIRGTATPLKSIGLMTPGYWLPISYIVEDGAYVEKGDVVAKFDSSGAEYELQTLIFEQKVVEQQLKYELNEIDNDRLAKVDSLASIVDQLNIAKATLDKHRKLPLEDEVQKAEGRLRIAKLEFEAAEKDFFKAEDRYKRKFISKAELEKAQQQMKEAKVSLQYAESDLEYEKLPATESTIKMSELNIENLELKKEDLEYELKELKYLQDIEKKLAVQKKKVIEKKIQDKKEDLENTSVKAVSSGYVKHMSFGSEKIGPGSKYFKGYRFADMPDLNTIVFEGYVPEKNRKFFNKNDRAVLYVNGRKNQPVEAYIYQIYDVPTDLAEKKSRRWGTSEQQTGLKVYRVEVKPVDDTPWLRPGMNASIQLISKRKIKLPAVPVKFVTSKEEKNYLSFDGVFKEVVGFSNSGWFFIEKGQGEGSVTFDGEFKKKNTEKSVNSKGEFMTSGEVVPTKSVKVVVSTIGRGESKITWLKEEESHVKKGEKILQLDTTEIRKRITDSRTRVANFQNQVDKLAKKLDLERQENEFMIRTEKNNLKIKEIKRDIRLKGLDYKATINARMNFLKAQIAYEKSVSAYKTLKTKNPEFISKAEFERAERDQIRKKLQLNKAEIEFEELKKGATEIEKSKANRDYVLQKVVFEKYVKNARYKEANMENELKRLKLRLEEYKFSLEKRLQAQRLHTLTAPADGLLRYGKVYDNGKIQKIALSVGLHAQMVPMTIPDLSSLMVKVKVPERYFTSVKPGDQVEIRIPSVDEKVYKGRVTDLEYILESLASKDNKIGIYSSQEPLGQNVFLVNIALNLNGDQIKPGVIADIYFPFKR